MSCAGGKILANFKYEDRAYERAVELVDLGVAWPLWVHHRDRAGNFWRLDRRS